MKKIPKIIFGIAAMFAFVAATPPIRYSIYTTGTVAQVDEHVSSVSTNVATNGVLSFNTRSGAVTLASNDVVTALGYAPGTGSGSGITNGQSGVWFPSLSASNSLTIRVGHTNQTPVLNWARQLSLFPSLYIAGGLSWDTNDNGTFSFIGGHLAGDGAGLTNLNASALASGTVPLARLSGITSNQFEAATWLLATNTTPGWRLTEPGYAGGTNTFEPVYTVTQGTNLFIRGNTNSAADGLYTVQTNWTDGEATAYLYTNANADVIWSREVDLDRIYTFTNAAGQANFTEGIILPTFQSRVTNTLSGGLCGTAAFGWTTNYTFGGFGVNGSTASDGAVLAFGQGLDYGTNGAVWTIYSTNITEACLSSNVWYWATNLTLADASVATNKLDPTAYGLLMQTGTGGGVTNDQVLPGTAVADNLVVRTNLGAGAITATTGNVIINSDEYAAWVTNGAIRFTGITNNIGVVLSNGFSRGEFEDYGPGTFKASWTIDGTNWSDYATNTPVTVGFIRQMTVPGDANAMGVSNVVLYSWTMPWLFGKTNYVRSQKVIVDRPRLEDAAAPLRTVKALALHTVRTRTNWARIPAQAQVDVNGHSERLTAEWRRTASADTNADNLNWEWAGTNIWTVSGPPTVSVDQTTYAVVMSDLTNVLVTLPAAYTSSVPVVLFAQRIDAPEWTRLARTATATNETMEVRFSVPNADYGFFRIAIDDGRPAFGTLNGVLELQPRTIGAANATTWGRGAGLVCVDSNYVYVAVGTNSWKRAAMEAW